MKKPKIQTGQLKKKRWTRASMTKVHFNPMGQLTVQTRALYSTLWIKIEITNPTFENLSHSSMEAGANKAEAWRAIAK
jgi:hypothetical protein